jgi:archaemetzincin
MLALAACQVEAATDVVNGETVRPTGKASEHRLPPDPFAFDPEFFEKKHKPGPDDWLASFHEPGQSFAQYVAQHPSGLTDKRNVIVLQPIGPFGKDEAEILEKLRAYAGAFFQLRVRIEKPVPLPDHGQRLRRLGDPAYTQYHTGTLMTDVLLPRLPSDAVCYLGITMADLYPDPAWNFVFGEASFKQRVGIYSLIRYTNRFWSLKETEASRSLFLRRSFKVLAHETGHMFSLAHCTENECLMNGSNSLDETDRNSIHLCPQCLRKLQWNLKFDVLRHYRHLHESYERNGYWDLAGWTARRLARLQH